MAIAHELCHVLFHRNFGQALGIASGPWASPNLEREANAFAAELLLPSAGAEAALAQRAVGTAAVREIADRYGVGMDTTIWQLANRVGAVSKTEAEAWTKRWMEERTDRNSQRLPVANREK